MENFMIIPWGSFFSKLFCVFNLFAAKYILYRWNSYIGVCLFFRRKIMDEARTFSLHIYNFMNQLICNALSDWLYTTFHCYLMMTNWLKKSKHFSNQM